jgi:hypothetical protein
MVTLNQLTYDLINIVRGGKVSDDEAINKRQVEFWIHNTRAQLIRQDLMKKRSISSNIVQTLGCVEVEEVDLSSCCNITIGCPAVRTKKQIPNPIELDAKDLITRVGPLDITAPAYNLIPFQRVPWVGNEPYTKHLKKAFWYDGYIYLIGDGVDMLKMINIQGVFADPTEVKGFWNCNNNSNCYTDDSAYPISQHMIETMKQMILQTDFKIAMQTPTDQQGDGKHGLENNVTQ